jgi:hypothetical protein
LVLANDHTINVHTSIRQEKQGEKITFISINTGFFRIKIVHRISLSELMYHKARIGFSTTKETDDLAEIETLILALNEAVKLAKQLNEKVIL